MHKKDCYLIPASEQGWQRKVYPNNDEDGWISPSGEEYPANPEEGTTACEDEVLNPGCIITP
jgi:hypothetical protein